MNDYLRVRIDALQKEVTRLEKKVQFLEAQLQVSKEAMFNQKFQNL